MGYINSIVSAFNRRCSIQTLEQVVTQEVKAFQGEQKNCMHTTPASSSYLN